ncbi:MAG TPA: hypothetical protein VFU55_00150 [Terracidiphilus sp.]|nr:hypothetical protein [Terracidiphilus sp.]
MKAWKVFLVTTLITLTIGGIYLYTVFEHRKTPGVTQQKAEQETLSKDDLVVTKEYFPQHFDDLARLDGATVWMQNGYTIPYFAYAGERVDFAKKMGLVPATQEMEIKKMIKAAAPAKIDDGIEHGSRQAFAVFTLPGAKQLYATPVGFMEGNEEAYYTDLLFYYDNPHKTYSYWGKDVWAAIDAHEVKPGMSELEVRMAIGHKMQTGSQTEGDRTVTYDMNGRKWTVTFVKNRATVIKQG